MGSRQKKAFRTSSASFFIHLLPRHCHGSLYLFFLFHFSPFFPREFPQRGKFFPQLTNLVKINTPKAVQTETRKAFRKMPNLEQAATNLTNLKGVGTTMASGDTNWLHDWFIHSFVQTLIPTAFFFPPQMKNKRIRDTVSTLLNIVVHFYCFFLPLWASNPSSPILPKPLSSNYVVPGITISFLSAHLLFNFFPHILLAPYAFIFPSSLKELTGLIYQFFIPSANSSEFSIAFHDMLPLFIDASTELSELFDLQNLNCLDTIWSLFFHTTFYYIISIHIYLHLFVH